MKNFTKITLALVLSLGLFTNAQAQEEGESVVSLGVGFVSFLGGDASLPPINLAYDYGLTDEISIGGYIGYASATEDLIFAEWNYTYFIVAARGLYHVDLIDDIDTYGGVLLGYNAASASIDGPDNPLIVEPSVGGVIFGAFVGGRYFFTDNIGAYLEVGYGIAAVNLGVNFKF